MSEILAFADKFGQDPRAKEFVTQLARFLARRRAPENARRDMRPYRWPGNPLHTGEFWDLASGSNAGDWIWAGLDPHTEYHLFDNSDFAVLYLEEMVRLAREHGAFTAKVTVHKKDIRQLEPPKNPLAVIRSKNVGAYVPGGEQVLERMAQWLAEGGQLIIQNVQDAYNRGADIEHLGPMIERLIAQGWRFEYDYGEDLDSPEEDYLALYTFKLTKPPGNLDAAARGRQATASQRAWEEYKARVAHAGHGPSVAIFRMF